VKEKVVWSLDILVNASKNKITAEIMTGIELRFWVDAN
jgi:hypothetical protein